MTDIWTVIVFSLIGSVVALVGGVLLLANKRAAKVLAEYATPFAAGALLAAAFLDLLKEALEHGESETALRAALGGILLFFFLERFLRWFHHHHDHNEKKGDPRTLLIIFGDTIHNLIDGLAIGAAFLVDPSTGVVTTLAVAAHEIPQEIGDFGLLLNHGLSRRRVLYANMLSAVATSVAAIGIFVLGQNNDIPETALLGLTAGFFIYIATSDIIPTIHGNRNQLRVNIQTVLLVLGVIVVGATTNIAHQFIEGDAEHTHTEQTQGTAKDANDALDVRGA